MRTLFLCKSALFSRVWDPLCIQAYFMVEGWLQQPQILCTLNSKAGENRAAPSPNQTRVLSLALVGSNQFFRAGSLELHWLWSRYF